MIDMKQKAKAVCQIIEYVTGLAPDKILIGYPNAGAPAGSYCTVTVTGHELFGQAMKEQGVVMIGGVEDILDITKSQIVLQLSINFYRDRAIDYIGAVKEANKRHPIHLILRQNGLGWRSVGPVQNLTGLFAANYEDRYQCNLYLYAEDMVSDTVNRVYQVEYGVSVDNQASLEGSVNGLSS